MTRRSRGSSWILRGGGSEVLTLLTQQAQQTLLGLDAFAAWAAGDASRTDDVREAEHACDHTRTQVMDTLRTAFSTPLAPEDLFQLSQGLDKVMNGAKDTVREAETMSLEPDAFSADMAALLRHGLTHLVDAITHIAAKSHTPAAATTTTTAADAAVTTQRRLEKVYRVAITDVTTVTDIRAALSRREMYRRLMRISDDLVAVADRIGYALVKQV